jgi:hypothetical protein
MPFVAPGQIPMSVAMPPPAPAHKSGMIWLAALVIAAAGYYYYTHHMQTMAQQPGATPPAQAPAAPPEPQEPPPGEQPGPMPGQPGSNPGQEPGGYPPQQPAGYPGQQPGGYPGQQPGGYPAQQPGGNPGQQPGGYPGQQPGGQGNQNQQAIAQAQHFSGRPMVTNGTVEIAQGQWQNGSNVTVLAARLECIQVSATGQNLTQFQTVLNGPLPAGQTMNLQTFPIGAEAQGAAKVNCGIVQVQTQN